MEREPCLHCATLQWYFSRIRFTFTNFAKDGGSCPALFSREKVLLQITISVEEGIHFRAGLVSYLRGHRRTKPQNCEDEEDDRRRELLTAVALWLLLFDAVKELARADTAALELKHEPD